MIARMLDLGFWATLDTLGSVQAFLKMFRACFSDVLQKEHVLAVISELSILEDASCQLQTLPV